jgi:hypothetical protein
MRFKAPLLKPTTVQRVLVFGQFCAEEPSLRHPVPSGLSFGVFRLLGRRFAVSCVLPKSRWGVYRHLLNRIF